MRKSHESLRNGNDQQSESTRTLIGFFTIGLFNNVSYIIMISGAKQFVESSAALAYIVAIFPGLIAKGSSAFWFDKISYSNRVYLCALLMFLGFNLVAIGSTFSILPLQLLGVAIAGFQAGVGESTFLAYTSHYNARKCLTAWSSGTGFSGIAGYGWNIFFTMGLQLDFRIALFAANIIIVGWLAAYFKILPAPRQVFTPQAIESGYRKSGFVEITADATLAQVQNLGEKKAYIDDEVKTFAQRFFGTEFAMQSGTWPAMGFPISDKKARDEFYQYSNWMYQVGVFISRSSGYWLPTDRLTLWIMPMLQTGLLIFFYFDALHMYWYDWSVLVLALFSGLLGGAVYVCAFLMISKEVKPTLVEMALGSACAADSLGILFGTFGGLFIQCGIYTHHNIPVQMQVC